MQLSHSVYVVTGAGSGLGLATATHLLERGARVALLDVNQTQGEQATAALATDNALFFTVDVTDSQQVAAAFAQIHASFGAVHGCINCAGIAPAKRVLSKAGEAHAIDTFRHVVDVNLIGSYVVGSIAAQYMALNSAEDEKGIIINTASIAGYEGQIGQSAYAASKAGIIGMCIAMARDLASQHIRVNTIAPGIMATPMLLAMPDEVQQALSDTVVYPKRLGAPSEFAELVAHICENTYLNGETIRLDGALRMAPN